MLARRLIALYALAVLVAMTWVSWYASTEPSVSGINLVNAPANSLTFHGRDLNVLEGFVTVCSEPWGLATMFDAYFGFLAFFLYVAWREATVAARLGWFVALMLLGNFAIAAYLLLALRAAPDETDLGKVFFARKAA